jgi:hypothetical protein
VGKDEKIKVEDGDISNAAKPLFVDKGASETTVKLR